jgi:hypothetical protein
MSLIPNKDKKTYSRSEKLKLDTAVSPGIALPGPLSLSVGLDRGTEVEFIRQFNGQREALDLIAHPPYNLVHVPITASRALALRETDYVKYVSRLAARVGLGVAASQGIVSIGGSVGYVVYGDFQIEIYRKPDSKVLFRATALKQRTGSLSLSAGLGYSLQVFGIAPIDRQISKRLIPTNFLSGSVGRGQGDLFIVEYEFNLKQAESRMAYDRLLNPSQWALEDFKIASPIRTGDTTALVLSSDLAAVEDLATQDQSRPFEERRVVRINRGRADFTTETSSLRVDLKLASAGWNESFLVQDFTFQDRQNDWHKYRLGTYVDESRFSFGFGWLKESSLREADIMFEIDQQGLVKKFVEMGFSHSRDDKTEFRHERNRVRRVIRRMLPEQLHDLAEVNQVGEGILSKDARIDIDLILHGAMFEALQTLSMEEIRNVIDGFVRLIEPTQYGLSRHSGYYGFIAATPRDNQESGNWLAAFKPEIQEITEKLPAVLSAETSLTPEQRWQMFATLKDNDLFNWLGAGLLMRTYYAHQRKLEAAGFHPLEVASFSVSIAVRDGPKIEMQYGDRERSESFKNLVSVKNRLLNRTFDPSYFQ